MAETPKGLGGAQGVSLRELANGIATMPAGTLFTIQSVWRGRLSLQSDPWRDETMRRDVAKMPAQRIGAILQRFWSGESPTEIAAAVMTDPRNVDAVLRRMRDRLSDPIKAEPAPDGAHIDLSMWRRLVPPDVLARIETDVLSYPWPAMGPGRATPSGTGKGGRPSREVDEGLIRRLHERHITGKLTLIEAAGLAGFSDVGAIRKRFKSLGLETRGIGGRPPESLIGQRYGRLEVIARAGTQGRSPRWLCRCDCGREKTVRGIYLKAGRVQSCGCLRNEKSSERMAARHATARLDRPTEPLTFSGPTHDGAVLDFSPSDEAPKINTVSESPEPKPAPAQPQQATERARHGRGRAIRFDPLSEDRVRKVGWPK